MVGFRLYINCLNGRSWFFPGPMETRNPGFRNVLSILFLLGFVSCNKTAFNPESFQRNVIVLHKIFNYIRERPHQMNIDVIFGITLTEANLVATLLHKNARYLENSFFNSLKEIIFLCDATRRDLLNIIVPRNENDLLLQLALNDPSLWIKPISWRPMFTEIEKTKFNPRLNYKEVINSIWRGTPNETESDRCLSAIVRSSLNVGCQIPETCAETLIRDDGTTGYPLTHRLLMVQVAKALDCREIKSVPFSDLISIYCARILQDLVNLEAWSFPSVAPDLMNEQIVLCGMEGFYEFIDKRYENLILKGSHQTHGCFSAFGFHEKRKITRRSSSATDFRCDNHSTGLAAAGLSLFIRKNVQDL